MNVLTRCYCHVLLYNSIVCPTSSSGHDATPRTTRTSMWTMICRLCNCRKQPEISYSDVPTIAPNIEQAPSKFQTFSCTAAIYNSSYLQFHAPTILQGLTYSACSHALYLRPDTFSTLTLLTFLVCYDAPSAFS